MSLRAVIDAIAAAVVGVAPSYAPTTRFRHEPRAQVAPYDWIRQPQRSAREFAIEIDSIMASPNGCLMQAELVLTVAYQAKDAHHTVMAGEDAGQLVQTLRNPSSWSGAAASVVPGEATMDETITVENRPVVRLVAIPLTAVYYP